MPRTKAKDKMVLVSIHLPKQMLEEINELVMSGKYPSVSELIRYAIRELINNTRGYLANYGITVNPQPQSQPQPQPQETHQAQQHVHMDLDDAVDLNADMKPVTNGPSNESIEYVIERLIEWAEVKRKSEEMTEHYRECVAKLVDAILNNLDRLRFNIKQKGEVYKISKKIIREFLEEDCMLPKGMVAASYYAIAEEFGKRGFMIMRTPTAIILKKKQVAKQEVVQNA